MILPNSTRLRSRVMVFSSVVCVALAALGSAPLRAQTPPTTPPEACTPGRLVDFCTGLVSGAPPTRAFLLDKRGYKTFQFPGAVITSIYDINNRGQMVGTYVDPAGPTSGGFTHGFLFEDGVFTTLDFPAPGDRDSWRQRPRPDGRHVSRCRRRHAWVPSGRWRLHHDRAAGRDGNLALRYQITEGRSSAPTSMAIPRSNRQLRAARRKARQ